MAVVYYHDPTGQGRHVETSIELARRETYSAISIAGSKRPLGSSHGDVKSSNSLKEFRTAPQHRQSSLLPPARLRASSIISVPLLEAIKKIAQAPTYSQRKNLPSTPSPSQIPLLSLEHPRYGIPQQLTSNLEKLGIHSIYPWQSSCLLEKGILAGETNLVCTDPTGGGKPLVADILLLKRIIENPSKKAIPVVPYVALVQEKVRWLRKVVEGLVRNEDGWTKDNAALLLLVLLIHS